MFVPSPALTEPLWLPPLLVDAALGEAERAIAHLIDAQSAPWVSDQAELFRAQVYAAIQVVRGVERRVEDATGAYRDLRRAAFAGGRLG